MARKMEAVEVFAEDGMVKILQASSLEEHDDVIMLHPSQVELIASWLKEAAAEAAAQESKKK